ncbi:MAG: arabinose isomerase, partial [Acidobacteriota bacterium]|nr:arabinose isomerase [Acidobacteriota bacterium]
MSHILEASTAGQVEPRLRIPRRKPLTANVGVFGVGHHAYWPQFEGLLDEMHRKLAVFVNKVRGNEVNVRDFGIVDDARSAYRLRDELKAASLDLIFCDMVTYATSATFGAIVRDVDVPIVLVALQPMKAMDYTRASTFMQLCNDDFCSIPEFTGVAVRMGKRPPNVILGTLEDDPEADAEIAEWCRIARVLHDLKSARIGHFGHVLENMLDMQTDHTALTAAFGCHIVETEPGYLMRHLRGVSDRDAEAMKGRVIELFDTPNPQSDPITRRLTPEDLDVAARAAVALERFVDEYELDGLAYYYEGEPDSPMRQLVTNLIVGNSLLTAAGFPMCGESDLKTCVAMLIEDRLDIGG